VTAGGRSIGAEVTELHQSSAVGNSLRRLQESERAGIVAEARALAEASAMPVVDVAVHFNDSVSITKSDRECLVNGLLNIVRTLLPGSEVPVTVELCRNPSVALPWIRTVRLFRASFLTKRYWAVPASG
jgi:hypothetical protein